jgi:uncharacterized protein
MFANIKVAHVIAGVARAAVLAVALFAVAGAAHAQQKAQKPEPSPAAMKLAREILDIKNTSALFLPVIPGVIERVRGMLLATNPTLRKDLDDVGARLRKEYFPRAEEMMTDLTWLYASQFSEAELKEIATFYRSAVGKKVLELEPKIFDTAMDGLNAWQESFADEVFKRFRAEMKKRGHDL